MLCLLQDVTDRVLPSLPLLPTIICTLGISWWQCQQLFLSCYTFTVVIETWKQLNRVLTHGVSDKGTTQTCYCMSLDLFLSGGSNVSFSYLCFKGFPQVIRRVFQQELSLQWFSESGPCTSNISDTGELAWNANSSTPFQAWGIRNSVLCALTNPLHNSKCMFKCESHFFIRYRHDTKRQFDEKK